MYDDDTHGAILKWSFLMISRLFLQKFFSSHFQDVMYKYVIQTPCTYTRESYNTESWNIVSCMMVSYILFSVCFMCMYLRSPGMQVKPFHFYFHNLSIFCCCWYSGPYSISLLLLFCINNHHNNKMYFCLWRRQIFIIIRSLFKNLYICALCTQTQSYICGELSFSSYMWIDRYIWCLWCAECDGTTT